MHAVSSGKDNTILETATGERETFDHIIFACHSDDTLRILDAGGGATPEERETLGAFCWSRNEVWLHSDESVGVDSPLSLSLLFARGGKAAANLQTCQLMPCSRLAWSCWNYMTRTTLDEQGSKKANDPQVSL